MNYIQLLFSFFNAPLFATFIIGLFWKRATPWGGFAGLVAGTFGALPDATSCTRRARSASASHQAADFWGAIVAFGADAIVTVVVSLADSAAEARRGAPGAGLGHGRDRPGCRRTA